jgi:hypothetical protein
MHSNAPGWVGVIVLVVLSTKWQYTPMRPRLCPPVYMVDAYKWIVPPVLTAGDTAKPGKCVP